MKFVATLGAAVLWSTLVPLALADAEPAKSDAPPPVATATPTSPIPPAPVPALVTRLDGAAPEKAETLSSIKVYPSF
jgi:hypothetical protein